MGAIFNVSETAKHLNISRRTIQRALQRGDIQKNKEGFLDPAEVKRALLGYRFDSPRGRKHGLPQQSRLNLRGGTHGRKASFAGRSPLERFQIIRREISALKRADQRSLIQRLQLIFPEDVYREWAEETSAKVMTETLKLLRDQLEMSEPHT